MCLDRSKVVRAMASVASRRGVPSDRPFLIARALVNSGFERKAVYDCLEEVRIEMRKRQS